MVRPKTVYPKAPITEALCDIRVRARENISFGDVDNVAKALSATYPNAEDQFEVSANLNVSPKEGAQSAVRQTLIGKRLMSEDKKLVVQAQLLGQSVSRLRPYAHWAELRTENQRVWRVYRDIMQPTSVTRLALRYINRIDIPQQELVPIEDYLRTYVEVSPDIKFPLSNFFAQMHIPLQSVEAMCVINTALLPPASPEVISILLDIDIFRVQNVPQRENEMWDVFDALRDAKNDIFEFSITDKTRELFR